MVFHWWWGKISCRMGPQDSEMQWDFEGFQHFSHNSPSLDRQKNVPGRLFTWQMEGEISSEINFQISKHHGNSWISKILWCLLKILIYIYILSLWQSRSLMIYTLCTSWSDDRFEIPWSFGLLRPSSQGLPNTPQQKNQPHADQYPLYIEHIGYIGSLHYPTSKPLSPEGRMEKKTANYRFISKGKPIQQLICWPGRHLVHNHTIQVCSTINPWPTRSFSIVCWGFVHIHH